MASGTHDAHHGLHFSLSTAAHLTCVPDLGDLDCTRNSINKVAHHIRLDAPEQHIGKARVERSDVCHAVHVYTFFVACLVLKPAAARPTPPHHVFMIIRKRQFGLPMLMAAAVLDGIIRMTQMLTLTCL